MTPGRRIVAPETVADYYRRGWWQDRTLLDDFLDRVSETPDAPAVVSYQKGVADPERHSYAQLELASRRCAAALLELGVVPGEAVSIQLPNRWEFPALVYGALRIGAVVNPLVPIFRRRELEFILGRTGTRVLVVPDRFAGHDYQTMAIELRETVDRLEHVVVIAGGDSAVDNDGMAGGGSSPSEIDFSAFMTERRWEDELPDLDERLAELRPEADDLVEIQFTSGTTGEPKGVLHSHNTVRSGGRVIGEVYGLESTDTCFMASTLAHQTGFGYGMLIPLAMGMPVVYQDVWDAEQLLDAIESEGIVWTVSATAFAMDMITAQRRRPRDVSSFRYFICGGAPIPPVVVEDAAEVLGAELVAVWGMTENMVTTTTRPGDPVELVSDSDGTPVDWMEIRVLDESGQPVGPDGVGDLQCRGPSQALGYFHRTDLYEAASPGDDWFDTGDVARVRSDGGIRIVGRTKDLVIRGGENVPVAEVESLLLRHPAVDEVVVIGLPDDRLGERACAVVASSKADLRLNELTAFLDEAGMAKQYWPERLEVMNDMPRTPSGKIQKFKLRELLGAER